MFDLEAQSIRKRRPWFRQVPILLRVSYGLAVAAGVVALVLRFVDGAPLGGVLAAVVAMVGAIATWWYPWVGLVVVLVGVATDAVYWEPLVLWTIAVFVVFAMALRGASIFGAGLISGAVAFLASIFADDVGWIDPAAITGFFASVTAAAIGNAMRNRDILWAAQEERARDAVAAREREMLRRVVEERLRIARDLHDVVGHEVAVVNMHLGVAEVNLPADSEAARAAIHAARISVQAVLSETQGILNVLRDRADAGAGGGLASPGVARLSELIESYRSIGVQIDSTIDLDATGLDPAVDVAVYRVLQEALTNVHRHGGGTAVVGIECIDDEVVVEVSNTLEAPTSQGRRVLPRGEGSGLGLVGMRERVGSVGGTLDAGIDGSTFVVRACVPADGVRAR